MPELFLVPPPSVAPPSLPDAHDRQQALDTTRSFIVEAPAGSGKTGLLIQRFLKLLASDTVTDPAQVLAITFTRKATGEMRERVLSQLAQAHAGIGPEDEFQQAIRPLAQAVLARDAQLGWNLLDHPHRLNIRTIDSVCTDIARSVPILSGAGGNLTPTEDAGPLHAEAARRTLLLLGGHDPALSAALRHLLLHRDGNLANCQALIVSMLAAREQWGELVPLSTRHLEETYLDSVVLPRIEKALDHAICRALTELNKVIAAPILDSLCVLAADMAHLDGYNGIPSPVALCAGKPLPPAEEAAHLDHWQALTGLLLTKENEFRKPKGLTANHLAFMLEKSHRQELARILDELRGDDETLEALCAVHSLPPAEYPPEQWAVTKSLFRVLSRALVELQLVFAERGECDFAEIGLLAKSALRRDSALEDLNSAAGIHLQHLLVDEMQDTSSSQYELIQLLTQRWDGHSQTVFLVGDPKQSIYLFRQARVERFVRTMHLGRLGDLPLGTLHLTANFRSQQALVADFNHDFAQLFPAIPDALHPELVPFRAAVAVRPPSSAAARVWHSTALPYVADPAQCSALKLAQSRSNASEIVQIVRDWQARTSTRPQKIAVLVRTRTHLLDIVKAFRQPGIAPGATPIPFRAVEIEPLAERQEILDLLALTRALLHPADRTAWLALLRTPWCGLALADLHILAGQDDPGLAQRTVLELILQRGDLLSPDGVARLEPFWTVMQAAAQQRGRLPLARWVARTWHAFAASAVLPDEALANANRFFQILHELEQHTGALDLTRLNRRLATLYAAPSVHPGAVDLMTIHGAKGLEWDVVFVPALERSSKTSGLRLLSWLEIDAGTELTDDEVAHGILAPVQGKGDDSQKLNTWMRSIEAAREAAERKRLLYVACTRAREELHLFAAPARKKKGDLSIPADSLLAAAWPAAQPSFAQPGFSQPSFNPPDIAPQLAQIHPMPVLQGPIQLSLLDSLAASVEDTPPNRILQRVPLAALHAANPIHPDALSQAASPSAFDRPEGSFAARAVGNTMHAFLELLAARIADGEPIPTLLAGLPGWSPRISAVLRASGLAPTHVQRFAASILKGLTRALTDPAGQWILAPHPHAASETSLASAGVQPAAQPSTLRLDRTFLAGPEPGSEGTSHRWIVDYKTATHGTQGLDDFLAREKEKYRPQLERYAAELAPEGLPVRLALFYPMLPELLWWQP